MIVIFSVVYPVVFALGVFVLLLGVAQKNERMLKVGLALFVLMALLSSIIMMMGWEI